MAFLRTAGVLTTILLTTNALLWHTEASAKQGQETIAIIKWATHPALNEVESSFKSSLEHRFATNKNLKRYRIELRNANGKRDRAAELAEAVSRPDVKLIVTFGTPASQAVARTRSEIPKLFAAVSDPVGAGLMQSTYTAGISNVNLDVVTQTFDLIRQLMPAARKVGTIYNPAEQNSVFVQGLFRDAISRYKGSFELVVRQASEPSRIHAIAQNLLDEVDVIYCANDNVVNLGITGLATAAIAARKLFIIGEISTIKENQKGPAIGIGVDYTETGEQLAQMAEAVLLGNSIENLRAAKSPQAKIRVSRKTLRAIGFDLPDDIRKKADVR